MRTTSVALWKFTGVARVMRPASAASEEDGEPRALSADLVVEEADFPALSLALGDLLDAKVVPEPRLEEWLDETLDGNRRTRALRRVEAAIVAPPPADDRIAGALQERVSGRTETAEAVMRSLLRETWLVADAPAAPALALEHPCNARVDARGRCGAAGVQARVRGRAAPWAAGQCRGHARD